MELLNCDICGALFLKTGHAACKSCLSVLEKDLEKIKEYIVGQPSVTLFELIEHTNVPYKHVMYWVRDGYIKIAK